LNALPRQKLCEIINIYGKDACNDHKRIRGLLNDFCRGSYPEINFLLMALAEKVDINLLASSKTLPYEMISARLVERLYANRGMANEIAFWAVDTWALALGVISNETPNTKPQVSFNVPEPGLSNATKSYTNTSTQQTFVVSPTGGQFNTISAAIKHAPPDALILVKPGYYCEGLIIDRRIKIKGDGPREQIIVESRNTSCIQMRITDEALVQGLTLRCRAALTYQKMHAVEIPMGCLKLIECDITSDTLACVEMSGHLTCPEIRKCWLHDAKGSGLLIQENAQGTIENCEIFGNSSPNIFIRHNANPIVKNCKIYGGKSHGILIWEHGTGTIEDCEIFGNASDGIKAKDGKAQIVKGCLIYKNARQEEWVYYNGLENTSFPRTTEAPGIRQQMGNVEIRSEATTSSVDEITEKAVRKQKVAQQPE
jgi:Right handed beta helix region